MNVISTWDRSDRLSLAKEVLNSYVSLTLLHIVFKVCLKLLFRSREPYWQKWHTVLKTALLAVTFHNPSVQKCVLKFSWCWCGALAVKRVKSSPLFVVYWQRESTFPPWLTEEMLRGEAHRWNLYCYSCRCTIGKTPTVDASYLHLQRLTVQWH